jgi:DNA-binding beta-propeller fold protein YncE
MGKKRMTLKSVLLASVLVLSPALAQAGKNDILVGLDQKAVFDANGIRFGPGGEDQLVVVDVSDPANPRIRAPLKLANSVLGPPTNLQITPDGRLALLANSVTTKETDGKWSTAPDDKLFVVDLDADPPKLIDTVTVGKQPSGLAISHDGKLALIANRAGKSVSVVAIDGTKVSQIAEVPMDDEVAAVAITPDGKRGFVVKNLANRIAVLSIDGQKVTYNKTQDMPAGYTPYNVEVTPDGRYALSVNQGGGLSGNVDTMVTIDAAANPPRVIDQTAVGDSPEGMAVGSNGVWVAVPLLKGSASKRDRWSYTKDGSLVLFSLSSGGKLQAVNELPTGGVPEGIAFSPDSHYVYVGNYTDKNLQVYRVAGGKLADTGKTLALPGQPASMRGLAR